MNTTRNAPTMPPPSNLRSDLAAKAAEKRALAQRLLAEVADLEAAMAVGR